MGDLTGLGLIETSVLLALRQAHMRPDAIYTKCAEVIRIAADTFGVGPRWGYEALCLLGRADAIALRVVDFHGNCGTADFSPALPEFTEVRLSPSGVLALAAEDEALAPLPLGLINGDSYVGGLRPPFDPSRMTTAVTALLDDAPLTDQDLIALVGPPKFPTGCEVGGDVDAMIAGEPVVLELSCRMERNADGSELVLTHLPPSMGANQLAELLDPATEDWSDDPDWPYDSEKLIGVADVLNLSEGTTDRVVCVTEPGTDLANLTKQLRRRWGVTMRIRAALPAPLPALLRQWVDKYHHEDLRQSLGKLWIVLEQGNTHPVSWREAL